MNVNKLTWVNYIFLAYQYLMFKLLKIMKIIKKY
jgi:hypothetical protein